MYAFFIFIRLTLSSAARITASAETFSCVPGTAHVLKGAFNIALSIMLGKSQTQPDGGEGCSAIATGIRRRILEGGSSATAG